MIGFFKNYKAGQIYTYEFLQKLGLSLIGIFIPIYIVSQGMGLSWAFRYLLINYASVGVLSIPLSYVISRVGFKHSMVVSYIFYVPGIVMLQLYGVNPVSIYLTAVLMSIGSVFHWVSLHAEFATDTKRENRGRETGRLLAFPRLAKAMAPALGGALLAKIGFGYLVGIAVFFLGLSALPLLASKDHRDTENWSIRAFLDMQHLKFALLFFLRGVGNATGKFLFPLYVFLVVGGSFSAGIVSSLTALGSTVFALLVGRTTQNASKVQLMVAGLLSSALFFSLRAFVTTAFQAFVISFGAGLVYMLYEIPLFSDISNIAEKEDVLEFYAFREIFLALGRITVLGTGLLLFFSNSSLETLKLTFHIAAVSTAAMVVYAGWVDRIQ